jgi:hypothetical protein
MIGVVDADPIEGSVLVDISNSVPLRWSKGFWAEPGERVPNREFTEIEISLMEGFSGRSPFSGKTRGQT